MITARSFCQLAFLLPVLLLICPSLDAQPDAHTKPNVVFILADDAGYGDLSCYGATHFKTPHLDQLAAEGMKFTDAHSPSAVCSPTRYSLLTGRYAWRSWAAGTTVSPNEPLLIRPDEMTVANVFQKAGYHTGVVGKWHLGFGRPGLEDFDPVAGIDFNGEIKPGPLEVGFDYFFGIPMVGQLPHIYIENHRVVGIEKLEKPIEFIGDTKTGQYDVPWHERRELRTIAGKWFEWANTEPIKYEHEDLAVRLTEEAVRYVDERAGQDQPFFLYFAHRSPHVPWTPHPQFEGSTSFETDTGQRYGEMMVELDWSVGEIMQALERNGVAENTLVIFSSDNGGALYYYPIEYAEREGHYANGPLRGQKTQVYEGGHRIPFIVRWPGVVEPGSVSDALVANTDFFATITELLETEIPQGQAPDSYSFLPVLTGQAPTAPVRDTLIMDSPEGLLAARRGPWKYIPAQGGGGFRWQPYQVDYTQPPAQLYNLEEDLREENNLFLQKPELAQELAAWLASEVANRDTVQEYLEAVNTADSVRH